MSHGWRTVLVGLLYVAFFLWLYRRVTRDDPQDQEERDFID